MAVKTDRGRNDLVEMRLWDLNKSINVRSYPLELGAQPEEA